jgi:hypothetical protein
MECTDGEIDIATGDVHSLAWAQGMAGEGAWIGLIKAKDTIPFYKFEPLKLFGEFSDDVTITTT